MARIGTFQRKVALGHVMNSVSVDMQHVIAIEGIDDETHSRLHLSSGAAIDVVVPFARFSCNEAGFSFEPA